MKKHFLLLLLTTFPVFMQAHEADPFEIRFIKEPVILNETVQAALRNSKPWQTFSASHNGWWVQFDENAKMPHRAFGNPIPGSGNNAETSSLNFLRNELKDFTADIDFGNAVLSQSSKYIHANYIQHYNGLEVLFSRATIKLTPDNRIVMFGLDIYNDIILNTQPKLSEAAALTHATAGIPGNGHKVISFPELKILPVAANGNYNYYLVYELEVRFENDRMPASYYTLVDANTGKIHYRKNKVHNLAGGTNAIVSGTVYPTNPYDPTATVPLQYIKVNNSMYADVNGNISLPSGTTSASFALEGLYGRVYTGQTGFTVQSFTEPLVAGSNNVVFDPHAGIPHRTAYYHTNVIHDFMKNLLPSFTSMDIPITIRVERTDGDCNAFYDGGINFYTTSNGCNALSLVADVIYHEYGHGICYDFYASQGGSFQNGAMGEGYADVWAFSATANPVLGIGYDDSDPTVFIRNYDFNNGAIRKVYPQHLSGEVHADGEIIAGAWWDVSLNLGSLSLMNLIFAESLFGLATGPDGDEGDVYTDILIDALFADDNDANLVNGTPNGQAIFDAFALHGITLITNSTLTHTAVETAAPGTMISIDAELSQINPTFAWAFSGVKAYYAINNSTTWTGLTMTTVNGTDYSVSFPPQQPGTIIKYYLGVEDINGKLTSVLPAGANALSDANIPYFITVGYNWLLTDDFDATLGSWQAGIPSDNATTGMWDLLIPTESEVNGSVVQPGYQVTPGGSFCFATGNAPLGSNAGTNDVDNGRTTLELQGINLSTYLNPAIEYYRWYSNDQGATPGTDFWQVNISEDFGTTWIPVEYTRTADHDWRRFVFRVSDYVSDLSNIYMQFIAEDANAGSLVEALIDDFSVYEQGQVSISDASDVSFAIYPSPASEFIYIKSGRTPDRIELYNVFGEKVFESAGSANMQIDVSGYATGSYLCRLVIGDHISTARIVVGGR